MYLVETFARAVFKRMLGKSHTSGNERDPANEPIPSNFPVMGQEVFAEFIDPSPAQALIDGASSALVRLYMATVSGTNNSGTYASYTLALGASVPASLVGKINRKTGIAYAAFDRIGDIIPQSIHNDYRPILYKSTPVEVPPLDACDWFIDTAAGVITQEDNPSGNMVDFTAPGAGYVDCFVYIGNFVSDISAGAAGNTLDGAYDQGSAGAGRIITADTGAVEINPTSTNAALQLTDRATVATTGLAAGQLDVVNGLPVYYDATRSKWLSIQHQFLVFGRRGMTRNQYLPFSAGRLSSSNSGYRIGRDATIVSISGQLDSIGSADIRIRKNDDIVTNIATLNIVAVIGTQDNSVNIDVSQGDFLQSFAECTNLIEDPMIIIEIAWRG